MFNINEIEEINVIKRIAQIMAEATNAVKVLLFGSFAKGTNTAKSDYDFYIIVDDLNSRSDYELEIEAMFSTHKHRKRAADVIVSRASKFEKNKINHCTIEYLVNKSGVVVYERKL